MLLYAGPPGHRSPSATSQASEVWEETIFAANYQADGSVTISVSPARKVARPPRPPMHVAGMQIKPEAVPGAALQDAILIMSDAPSQMRPPAGRPPRAGPVPGLNLGRMAKGGSDEQAAHAAGEALQQQEPEVSASVESQAQKDDKPLQELPVNTYAPEARAITHDGQANAGWQRETDGRRASWHGPPSKQGKLLML